MPDLAERLGIALSAARGLIADRELVATRIGDAGSSPCRRSSSTRPGRGPSSRAPSPCSPTAGWTTTRSSSGSVRRPDAPRRGCPDRRPAGRPQDRNTASCAGAGLLALPRPGPRGRSGVACGRGVDERLEHVESRCRRGARLRGLRPTALRASSASVAMSSSTRSTAPVDWSTPAVACTPASSRSSRPSRESTRAQSSGDAASRARAMSTVRLPSRRSSPAGFPVAAGSPKTPSRSSRSWNASPSGQAEPESG